MTTVADVLGRYTVTDPAGLESALLEREDGMVSSLHMAAVQFGLYPQIVAEVIASIGLGTPPDPDTRALIHGNFVRLMEQIQTAMREGREPPPPGAPNNQDTDPRGEDPT